VFTGKADQVRGYPRGQLDVALANPDPCDGCPTCVPDVSATRPARRQTARR
jgi:hypothetical protein